MVRLKRHPEGVYVATDRLEKVGPILRMLLVSGKFQAWLGRNESSTLKPSLKSLPIVGMKPQRLGAIIEHGGVLSSIFIVSNRKNKMFDGLD